MSICVPEGRLQNVAQSNLFISDYPNGHRQDVLTMESNLKWHCAGVMGNHSSTFEINLLLKEIRNANGVKMSQ